MKGVVEYVNPSFTLMTGYTSEDVLGNNYRRVLVDVDIPEKYQQVWDTISSGIEWTGQFHNRKKSGEPFWEKVSISPIRNQEGKVTHFLAIKEDISVQKMAETERVSMEIQLRQAQKLESIGQLAAGIAHEINTPIQFIGDNTRFLKESFGELLKLLKEYEKLSDAFCHNKVTTEMITQLAAVVELVDVEYLNKEIPKSIQQSLDGVERVAKIVRAMKEFSHPGTEQKTAIDLNHAIESTTTVARNEWKYVADLALDLDQNLPRVPCLPGRLTR